MFNRAIGFDFRSVVLGRFEIEFCVHIDFCKIVNPFFMSDQIKFGYKSRINIRVSNVF